MPTLEELRKEHTAATDRAIAAQTTIRHALSRVGEEVAQRVTDLDAANRQLAHAAQAVTNAGGAVPPHADLPYLATPTSIEMQALLNDVRALPARVATARSHQQAIGHIADHEKKHAAEHEARLAARHVEAH
jgi:hypothetical protein